MTNRLAASSSPYLLQHADNPVDWHEWGPDALALARDTDTPILLSVGYAACHWCHVMAHESFEDAETAELMNRLFVNVKVDREQRPDLDRIYQLAHQVMMRRGGGWPLTAFLDPHTQQPFFIGTYFPKDARHGLPPFRHVLERVAAWYHEQPDARARNNEVMAEFFSQQAAARGAAPAATDPAAAALAALADEFDPVHGGSAGAPKFPHATQLQWLLRRGDERAAAMARLTLEKMSRGGLFDHLGGGYARYSVDERWEIPHFEKMLYDNGLLLAALAEAGDAPVFRRAARLTAGWLLAEMQHADGGFFASVDADSEGHEGRFYVWDARVARDALTDAEWAVFAPAFRLDRVPNFEGAWHLHNADDADLDDPLIRSASAKLLALRDRRVRPATDDKVLAAWNGLAIRGLAMAGTAFAEPSWVDAAQRAADFVRREMWRDGRLATSWRDGHVLELSFLDDHAFLLDGLIELLRASFDPDTLHFAIALADALLERFEDAEHGGFHFTPHDHEALIQRPKGYADDATPNGNGVVALALARLGRLLGDTRYLDAAARTLDDARGHLGAYPHAHAAVLLALDEHDAPPTIEIYRGTPAQLEKWGQSKSTLTPSLAFRVSVGLDGLPGQLARQPAIDGRLTRYRCVGTHCEAPEVLSLGA